jgi:hypothetical protein
MLAPSDRLGFLSFLNFVNVQNLLLISEHPKNKFL